MILKENFEIVEIRKRYENSKKRAEVAGGTSVGALPACLVYADHMFHERYEIVTSYKKDNLYPQ